jgi:hypothetical protein
MIEKEIKELEAKFKAEFQLEESKILGYWNAFVLYLKNLWIKIKAKF